MHVGYECYSYRGSNKHQAKIRPVVASATEKALLLLALLLTTNACCIRLPSPHLPYFLFSLPSTII